MSDRTDGIHVNFAYEQNDNASKIVRLVKFVFGGVCAIVSVCGIMMIENMVIINVLNENLVENKNHILRITNYVHNTTL
ncbi:hypothetical protein [Neodiprion sertifer nucleopolyhedrovirus]|uniref:Uncharacterized protein n=1 Tax=Neodiprion sertifer nucleopolyhedrovirus TaxID=111874 RepID=Q6JK96_9CBAC|nr:hypothetical protein NeseNPV_gp64 [Neodiprion sertifer nucleopolyhedrovirus]AAQ96441.1 hypothetical protein [Neodiprion sertifer nucleopolyhedrovirus]